MTFPGPRSSPQEAPNELKYRIDSNSNGAAAVAAGEARVVLAGILAANEACLRRLFLDQASGSSAAAPAAAAEARRASGPPALGRTHSNASSAQTSVASGPAAPRRASVGVPPSAGSHPRAFAEGAGYGAVSRLYMGGLGEAPRAAAGPPEGQGPPAPRRASSASTGPGAMQYRSRTMDR